MTLLQPHGNRFPNTEREFDAMTSVLCRLGHMIERAPNNVASALRQPPCQLAGFVGAAMPSDQAPDPDGGQTADPWQTEGLDPWAAGRAAQSPLQQPPQAAQHPSAAQAFPASATAVPDGYESGASSDTSSDIEMTPLTTLVLSLVA